MQYKRTHNSAIIILLYYYFYYYYIFSNNFICKYKNKTNYLIAIISLSSANTLASTAANGLISLSDNMEASTTYFNIVLARLLPST